jgi:hypothetical protein
MFENGSRVRIFANMVLRIIMGPKRNKMVRRGAAENGAAS